MSDTNKKDLIESALAEAEKRAWYERRMEFAQLANILRRWSFTRTKKFWSNI